MRWLLCLILYGVLICYTGARARSAEWAPYHTVVKSQIRVVDGDTLAIRGRPVRIFGIQAPEIHRVCPEEIAIGKRAKAKGEEIIAQAQSVRIQYERVKNRQTGKMVRAHDRYGRSLGRVLLDNVNDWSQVMLEAELAKPWDGKGPQPTWCAAQQEVK